MFLIFGRVFTGVTCWQCFWNSFQARKALRALKGIVKLQAYIRGRAVRRQAMTTLKCLQSVVNIQSQVYGLRTQIPGVAQKDYEESNKFQIFSENMLKVRILLFKKVTLWKRCSTLFVCKKIYVFRWTQTVKRDGTIVF